VASDSLSGGRAAAILVALSYAWMYGRYGEWTEAWLARTMPFAVARSPSDQARRPARPAAALLPYWCQERCTCHPLQRQARAAPRRLTRRHVCCTCRGPDAPVMPSSLQRPVRGPVFLLCAQELSTKSGSLHPSIAEEHTDVKV